MEPACGPALPQGFPLQRDQAEVAVLHLRDGPNLHQFLFQGEVEVGQRRHAVDGEGRLPGAAAIDMLNRVSLVLKIRMVLYAKPL